MKAIYLSVYLEMDNTQIKVGELADVNRKIYFEYDAEFVAQGLELSPFKLPLRLGAYTDIEKVFAGLPGVFYDSLPDGWGLLLMSRYFKKQGIDLHKISPLERLAFVGNRAMGALIYAPATPLEIKWQQGINLELLASDCEQILQGHAEDILPELIILGGSPGGARPKVLVDYDATSKQIAVGVENKAPFQPYLVKFSGLLEDLTSSAEIEFAYAEMARDSGIHIPEHQLLNAGRYKKVFAVKRFDREGKRRIHMHTLSGLLHADFRLPNLDYIDFLNTVWALTQDFNQVVEGYKRMVFNVLLHNRDDHSKNFSFLFENKVWRLSPAYDLTFSDGIAGEHTMTIAGEGANPEKMHLLKVAEQTKIPLETANAIIENIIQVRQNWTKYADKAQVTQRVTKQLANVFSRIIL